MAKRTRAVDGQLEFDLRVKTCSRCKQQLAGWDFSRNKYKSQGLDCYCTLCARAKHQEFRASHPEYCQRVRNRSREWGRENADHVRRQSAAWYRSNRERRRQRSLAWSDANRQRHRDLNKAWAKANPDAARAIWSRYYALKTTAQTVPFTATELKARWAYYGNCCWICRTATATATDHVKPLAKGGAHMLCNLRPVCAPCNGAKRDKWPFSVEMIRRVSA